MNRIGLIVGALALGACSIARPAFADDPRDKAMQNAAAHAADSASTKQLNQTELSYVLRRKTDSIQSVDNARVGSATSYARAQADYERQMASWRHAVAACESGQWEYCRR